MTRHHFKVTVLPAAIVDVCCLDADYTGPAMDRLHPREVVLDPTVFNRTADEMEVTVLDRADLAAKVDDICNWSALDPESLAGYFDFGEAAECEESEPA